MYQQKFTIGDVVRYSVPGNFCPVGEGTVIGYMAYGDDVCCLAGPSGIGMPINEAHCQRIGYDFAQGAEWRQRYAARFPDTLAAPEPADAVKLSEPTP
jgi:hypothetical protein